MLPLFAVMYIEVVPGWEFTADTVRFDVALVTVELSVTAVWLRVAATNVPKGGGSVSRDCHDGIGCTVRWDRDTGWVEHDRRRLYRAVGRSGEAEGDAACERVQAGEVESEARRFTAAYDC